MNNLDLDKKRVLVAGIACVLILVAVSLAEHVPFIEHFLEYQSPNSATQSATAAHIDVLPKTNGATAATSSQKININTASQNELMTLSGIGPAKAAAVVAYRFAHGNFLRIDDITKVAGIGQVIFNAIKDSITVGTTLPPPSRPPTVGKTPKVSASGNATSTAASSTPIRIAAVMTGTKHNAAEEYIELYNPGDERIDLSGWSIHKQSSTGAISLLVAASHFAHTSIAPKSYLLIARSGYTGTTTPDIIWPASYSLSRANETLLLIDDRGATIDTVAWSEIPPG